MKRTENDLTGDVVFGNVLNLAVMAEKATPEVTKPLLDYIAAKPLYHPRDRAILSRYVHDLLKRIDELQKRVEPPRGRRPRDPNTAPVQERAERNAAWLVAFTQAEWRRRHDRERVPVAETGRMIQAARREAARAFNVPVSQISEVNIRNALKSGRVVVR